MYDIRAKEQSAEADRCKQSANKSTGEIEKAFAVRLRKAKEQPLIAIVYYGCLAFGVHFLVTRPLWYSVAILGGLFLFTAIEVMADKLKPDEAEATHSEKSDLPVTRNDKK